MSIVRPPEMRQQAISGCDEMRRRGWAAASVAAPTACMLLDNYTRRHAANIHAYYF